MRKKILKCVSLVALFAFIFANGTKTFAADYHTLYDSPEPSYVDLVFSVAKGETDDQTKNGIQYDGRPYGDYDQIHTNPNKSGNNGRYAIHNVSGSAITANIQELVGGDAHNLNETLLSEESNMFVETVLQNYLGIEEYENVCEIAANYIAANRGLEIGFYRETWFIDWYVIKYQQENGGRIHVDGKYVEFPTIEEEPEEEPIITEPVIADDPEEEEDPVVPEPEEKPEEVITSSPTTIPPVIFIIPPFAEEVTDTPTPTPSPEPTATPTEAPAEEIIDDIEPIETPEGTPVEEEIDDITPVETPEGAPEEEEEEIPIELPEVPEGDVLPQTGVASSVSFYGLGLLTILLGLFTIKKIKRLI